MSGAPIFGPTFGAECIAAGLGGLPFACHGDGTITDRNLLTPAQNATLDKVIAAHDPAKQLVPAISKRQALTWLLSMGKTEADVVNAINTIADSNIKAQALIDWNYPDGPFHRSNAMFDQLAPAIGMTPAQMDAAFIAAKQL